MMAVPFPGIERKLTSEITVKEIPDLWPPRQGGQELVPWWWWPKVRNFMGLNEVFSLYQEM